MQWLIDIISQFWQWLVPFETVAHYDRGVVLRFGKAVIDKSTGKPLVLEPGFHWKWPFGIDDFLTEMIKVTTLDIPKQLLTTKDGKSVLVGAILKYETDDVATLKLEVDSPVDAVSDMCQGELKTAIMERNWEACNEPDLEKQVTQKIRKEAKTWGIKVKSFTLTNLTIVNPTLLLNIGT